MITYEQALLKILEDTPVFPSERVGLDGLLNRFLAEPVIAPNDLPNFDNSAVDGFGVKIADVEGISENKPCTLKLVGTISAGDNSNASLSPGHALKILTGATVVEGVEAVVMKEFCLEQNGTVEVYHAAQAGENIRRRGEEYHAGQKLLNAGTRITPPVIGMLATLGCRSTLVHAQPRVAVIVTGNELIEPGRELTPGQIYDSNSYALIAAINETGVENISVLHAKDNKLATKEALETALQSADVIISTGGVSVGDYDFVKDVAEEIGVSTMFWRIAIKPGKPVYFGLYGSADKRKLVFGLPGNPVSALVTFQQLVRPSLLKMQGATECLPQRFTATLASAIRKKPGRMEFVRGVVQTVNGQMLVQPTAGQESHMLGGLCQANCLIHFPTDDDRLSAGSAVNIELLSWI